MILSVSILRSSRVATIVLCALLTGHAEAVIFHDGASNAQRILEFAWQQAEEIRKYALMIEQAHQMVQQVQYTIAMVEQAAKHLTEMPKAANILEWLVGISNQTTSILGQVQYLGFQLDQTTRQFEAMYRNIEGLTTPEGRAERLRLMQEARLEMTHIAMQTQSIRQTFTGIFTRLAALLGVSSFAEGTRALQQIQMQQAALQQQQAQLGLTMQAVSARLEAMKQAEDIVIDRMRQEAAAHNAALFMTNYTLGQFRGPHQGQGFVIRRE